MLALKAWYCDSTHRYAMTDAVQPLIVTSASARKPAGNPKADLRRYYMLAHGSHLVDTARYLAGEIVSVDARLNERFGAYCWFVDVEFASGALGHLDLTVAVRMDWHEGFQIYGQNGSVVGKTFNPWYFKSSEVDIFREATGATTRILGADGHFYRRQVEGFADTILHGAAMRGADIDDGVASVRAMIAISQSAWTAAGFALADVIRGAVMQLGIFAKTFAGQHAFRRSAGGAGRRLPGRAIQHGLLGPGSDAGCHPRGRGRSRGGSRPRIRRAACRRLGDLQHDPPGSGRPPARPCEPARHRGCVARHGHRAAHALYRHARP